MIKKTCGPFMRRATEEEKEEHILRIRMKMVGGEKKTRGGKVEKSG